MNKGVSSQKLAGNAEGARRPTAGDEGCEFTSHPGGGRVPPFIEKLHKGYETPKAFLFKRAKRKFSLHSGFSLLELIVAILIFMTVFAAAMKLFIESNLPKQAMVRDYAVALNICERFLNSLQNDVMCGNAPPFTASEMEVTEAVLENPAIQDYLKVFTGGVGRGTTELISNFKAFLKVGDEGDRVISLRMRFEWGKKPRHQFTLESHVFSR